MDVESSLVPLILGGHFGVLSLVSEEADIPLASLNGAFELVDLSSGGGEVFFGDSCALADGVYQPPRDSAGGFADVCVVSNAEDGCGGSG